jgi:uncharacterized RDD family membrane protein YckC
MLLDGFIFPIFLLPLAFVIVPAILLLKNTWVLLIPVIVLAVIAVILTVLWYYAKLEASPKMGTYGKRIMGIQTTDLNGQRISFGTAVVRLLVKSVLSGILAIGYIMAFFTARKQALHDMIAGTIVTRRRP